VARELGCWNCGKSVADVPLPISRHATCRHCFEVLHCCRMCRHYAPRRPGDCDHDRAEPPVIKESANFCEYFTPVNRFERGQDRARGAATDRLSALFGEDDAGDPAGGDGGSDRENGGAKSKLDDLFDD